MSANRKPDLSLGAPGVKYLEAVSEHAGVSSETYLSQSVTFGIFCANIVIANQRLGVLQTNFLFEAVDGSFEPVTVDFKPDADSSSDGAFDLIEPFAGEQEIDLLVPPETDDILSGLLEQLETDMPTFLDMAIFLRQQAGATQMHGGKVAAFDASCDEYREINIAFAS